MNIKEKVIFIAGGGSGIGKDLVSEFISRGWYVIYSTRDKKGFEENNNVNTDSNFFKFTNDFSKKEINEEVKKIIEEKGGVDIFLSAIGGVVDYNEKIHDISEDSYINAFELNFHRPRRALETISPYLKNDLSKIIFLSSLSAIRPSKINFDYSVSKSALRFYGKGISYDYAKRGIGVLSLALNTFMSDGIKREMDLMKISEYNYREQILVKRPLKILDCSKTLSKKIASLLELDLGGITGSTINFDYGSLEGI